MSDIVSAFDSTGNTGQHAKFKRRPLKVSACQHAVFVAIW
jgi:hypothetical protein